MTAIWLDRLAGAVGSAHVAGDEEQLRVAPGAATEITDVLRIAREMNAQVGVGHKSRGIAIDLGRMRNILHLDETSLVVSVQAGITAEALEAVLIERGLTLGVLPATARTRTVGALMAAPRPSEANPRIGRFTAACAGLSGLLADGTELSTRVAPRKATGPDLAHLLIGTRGALALITSVTLRVERRGEARAEAAWSFADRQGAFAAVRRFLLAGARPADLVVTAVPHGEAATLLALFDGTTALVEAERNLLHRLALAAGGQAVPHLPEPVSTSRPYEERYTLASIDSAPKRGRAVGWHLGGVAVVDYARAAVEPGVHPLTQALKQELDPERRLVSWPAG